VIDFKDISDLSPAPRRTPTSVLWAMAAVVCAGSAALIWAVPADNHLAEMTHSQSRPNHAVTKPAAPPASTSSRSPAQ
jgi:hypothetical protein